MRYLFRCWKGIERRMRRVGGGVILSDFDGTLTPIMARPDLAVLSEEMRQLLRLIVEHPRYRLAVISGRAVEDVKRLVGVEGVFYVGNHGFEITGPKLSLVHPEAERVSPVMGWIREELGGELGRVEGVIVEDKRLTLSVHFRLVQKEDVATVKRAVGRVVGRYGEVEVRRGKKVFEIRPRIPWDKGKAALWVLKSIGGGGLPLYLGDDVTDEDAFSALRGGVTILVSERRRPSKARYFLKDTTEVQQLFNELLRIDWSLT